MSYIRKSFTPSSDNVSRLIPVDLLNKLEKALSDLEHTISAPPSPIEPAFQQQQEHNLPESRPPSPKKRRLLYDPSEHRSRQTVSRPRIYLDTTYAQPPKEPKGSAKKASKSQGPIVLLSQHRIAPHNLLMVPPALGDGKERIKAKFYLDARWAVKEFITEDDMFCCRQEIRQLRHARIARREIESQWTYSHPAQSAVSIFHAPIIHTHEVEFTLRDSSARRILGDLSQNLIGAEGALDHIQKQISKQEWSSQPMSRQIAPIRMLGAPEFDLCVTRMINFVDRLV